MTVKHAKETTALWHRNSIMWNRVYGARGNKKELLLKGGNLTCKSFCGPKHGNLNALMKIV
jgi:hypothetical protein